MLNTLKRERGKMRIQRRRMHTVAEEKAPKHRASVEWTVPGEQRQYIRQKMVWSRPTMVATSTRARFCFASVPVGSKELDHAACHDGRRRYRSPIGNSSSVHARRRRDHGIIIIHHNRWLPAAAAACHGQLEWSRLSSNNAIHPSTGPCTHWCTLLDPPLGQLQLSFSITLHSTRLHSRIDDRTGRR